MKNPEKQKKQTVDKRNKRQSTTKKNPQRNTVKLKQNEIKKETKKGENPIHFFK